MNIAVHAANGISLHQFCLPLMQQLTRRGHRVVALAAQDSFFPLIAKKNIPIYNTRATADTIAAWSVIRYAMTVYRILKREQIQLIHLMTPKAILFITVMARLMGSKVVCVFTGLGYTFTLPRYHPMRIVAIRLLRIVLRAAHRVVFLNPDDRDDFVSSRIVSTQKARLIRSSGVDIRRYARSDSAYPQTPVFVFVGRLLVIKGIVQFLEAAREIGASQRTARFLVVGGNTYGNRAMISDQQIAHYQAILGANVEFSGSIHDVRPHLQRSSVLVLPTRYREGTPQSILEAMACALPIITTDMPGCRETVIDGQNGFLVPPADHRALVEKMAYFIDHPEQISQMGQQSHRIVRQHFTTDHVNRQTIALYRSMGLVV